MQIIRQHKNLIKFMDIPNGEWFEYKNNIYLKIDKWNGSGRRLRAESSVRIAYGLGVSSNGCTFEFSNYELVYLLETELLIKN